MKFDFDKWQDEKVAIHCKTEEEANDLCKELDENGFNWIDGTSYLDDNCFDSFLSKTVYYFNEGMFGEEEESINEGYLIFEWSDYMNKEKEFTKSDLQTGDFVVTRCGEAYLVIHEKDVLLSSSGWNPFNKLNEDLTYNAEFDSKCFDVMKVYRPTKIGHCSFQCYMYGELVYSREKVKISKKEIAEWKNLSVEEIEIVD